MQSQAACAVMHPQFNLIYLSKLLSLYCEELWERKSQFHRLLCLECFYGLLHTKASIGIYKQMNNDHSSCWGEKKQVTCFAEHVQRTEVCQVYLFSTCLFLLFCQSNPCILRPCVNKALVVDNLNKHFFLHPL